MSELPRPTRHQHDPGEKLAATSINPLKISALPIQSCAGPSFTEKYLIPHYVPSRTALEDSTICPIWLALPPLPNPTHNCRLIGISTSKFCKSSNADCST